MSGVAKNGAGTERLHSWGSNTDCREAATERVGREIVLPHTGGGHEGSRVHRRKDVYKQKAEHGRAINCNATASVTLQGDDAARQGELK